jgi:prophage regulatory protein
MEEKNTPKRVLRMKDLPPKIGFQPSTIYELISKGKFPSPFKLVPGGRAAGWFETTIDEWLVLQAEGSKNGDSK